MKKPISLIIVAILVFSLGACAAKEKQKQELKCPSCGYQGLDFIYQP